MRNSQTEIAALRAEIPSLDSAKFRTFPQLGEGSEAKVYHDEEGKVVYKLFKVQDGKTGAFVPGQMRLAGWANSPCSRSASHLPGIP